MIKHESEGYYQGGWKSQSTRLNQIRFYNEVLQNKTGLTKDGLTTLKFKKISETNDGNYTMLSVELWS